MRVKLIEPELGNTFFHRLDARTKLIMLLCIAVINIALYHWTTIACGYLLVLALVINARLSWDKVKALIVITFLTIWGIMWVQAMFYDAYPRTPLVYLVPPKVVNPSTPVIGGLWEGLAIYYEGFTYGIKQSLRLVTPMTLGLLIFWTENPMKILVGLTKLKLPYVISFMVMTCLRFIPITIGEARVTLSSQKLRKYKPFDIKGIVLGYGLFKTTLAVMLPLLANCVRKSTTMARSADSRAFRAYEERSELYDSTMKAKDKILIGAFTLSTTFILTGKLLLYLWVADKYYNEALQPLYWFVHWYL